MPGRALLYGRFQPFHRGHVAIALWAFREAGFDELVFLVGMASESYTRRNPFTAGERIEMIRLSMRDAGIPLDRVITATIPTLETSIGLAGYVLSYVPRVDALITGNTILARIFRDHGLRVLTPPAFRRGEWNGGRVRRLLALGDPAWREAVTPSVAEYLESIGAPGRLRDLYSSD
ncbi:nicotinamide-nucleotide adenylyltransferase [Stetteria hydrogenophila]